jgi:short-subunit dehydrogenase
VIGSKDQPPTALVTGASAGIGAAIARGLAERGLRLILVARGLERLEAVAASLPETAEPLCLAIDLSTAEGASELLAAVADREIDILVNNAGGAPHKSFLETAPNDVEGLMQLNMATPSLLMHGLIPRMKARRKGRILNVASMGAFHPVPGLAQYGAAKAYLLMLTEALNEELRGSGISLTVLCPGITRTDLVAELPLEELPEMLVQSPEYVAQAGIEALFAQEVVCVPGRLNQAALAAAKLPPRPVLRALGGLFQRWTQQGT